MFIIIFIEYTERGDVGIRNMFLLHLFSFSFRNLIGPLIGCFECTVPYKKKLVQAKREKLNGEDGTMSQKMI